MALPFAYNWRNLTVRKTTTVMTALGIALTVAVLMAVVALVDGLDRAFEATGNPLQVLVLRKGSDSELASNFTRRMYQDLKFKVGIAKSKSGEPRASLEMVTVVNLARIDSPDGMNVTIRGLTPVGIEMREELRLLGGRWFETGRREVVVGASIAKRFPGAEVGKKIHLGQGEWEVVGVMEAGRGVANSEIFADLNQLSADYNRVEVVSSCLVEAVDEVAVRALINDMNNDQRLNVAARTERDYYETQKRSGAPIQYIGTLVAIIMAIGSSFAAMNTMYAAVARRAQEIGTLRVLGFSRGSILLGFLAESLLLSALGGVIGCLLILPLNGVTTGIGNLITFSEVAFNFHLGPRAMANGILFALVMGVAGGLFPALMAARKEILTALREI